MEGVCAGRPQDSSECMERGTTEGLREWKAWPGCSMSTCGLWRRLGWEVGQASVNTGGAPRSHLGDEVWKPGLLSEG